MIPSTDTLNAYKQVPDHIKEDVVEAAVWARTTLTNHEGSGHEINVVGDKNRMVICCFAKPAWSGDHSGPAMETASEAIVMAVCSYLNGQ